MSINRFKILFSMASIGLLLLFTSMAWAQDDPGACVELGANAYNNWTKEDSGGTGSLPVGVESKDYIRCKACHGWDHKATDGGYVRRSRKSSRPNAGAGDGDATSRNISLAARAGTPVTADMIFHAGSGRSYADGAGSWVAQNETHSAANKAAHANGYTLGNQHPDFSADSLTQEQADCLAEFLNFADADPSVYFADINTSQNPALYTIVDTADAAAGEVFYNDTCDGCHGDPAEDATPFALPDGGGVLSYLDGDGKFSELSHAARWGIPDEAMSRDALGSPGSADIANMLLYLQQLGGTGFAMNPGMTGTWWNGPDRSGEGFPMEVGFSGDDMILWVTFFTYNNMGGQTWLTAVGTVTGNTVEVDVFMPEGRMWGHDFDPADGTTTPWGSGIFTFTSCKEGHMALTPNDEMMGMMRGFSDIDYDLMRFDDFVLSGIDCPN